MDKKPTQPNLDASFIAGISANAETTASSESKDKKQATEYQVFVPLELIDKARAEHFAEDILTFHSEQGTEVHDRAIQVFCYYNQEQTQKHILLTFKL